MLAIEKVDHIGIRVGDKTASIAFYELLGFQTLSDTGFAKGHPIIMQHPSGVVLNLLGPATVDDGQNVLMDLTEKHPGITHVSFKVDSIENAKEYLAERQIPISGEFSYKDLRPSSCGIRTGRSSSSTPMQARSPRRVQQGLPRIRNQLSRLRLQALPKPLPAAGFGFVAGTTRRNTP